MRKRLPHLYSAETLFVKWQDYFSVKMIKFFACSYHGDTNILRQHLPNTKCICKYLCLKHTKLHIGQIYHNTLKTDFISVHKNYMQSIVLILYCINAA